MVGAASLIHANTSFRLSPRLGAIGLAMMMSKLRCFGVRAVSVLNGVPRLVIQRHLLQGSVEEPSQKIWLNVFLLKESPGTFLRVHSLFSTPACGTLARPGACVLEGSTFRTGLLTFWSWFMQMNSQIVAREKWLEGFIFFRWPGLALCSPDPELSRTELQGLQRSVPGQWMPSHP